MKKVIFAIVASFAALGVFAISLPAEAMSISNYNYTGGHPYYWGWGWYGAPYGGGFSGSSVNSGFTYTDSRYNQATGGCVTTRSHSGWGWYGWGRPLGWGGVQNQTTCY